MVEDTRKTGDLRAAGELCAQLLQEKPATPHVLQCLGGNPMDLGEKLRRWSWRWVP
jgi:hypothetical protein